MKGGADKENNWAIEIIKFPIIAILKLLKARYLIHPPIFFLFYLL